MQYKWKAVSITTIGTLMAGIDTRILVVGLPTIAQQLQANAEESIWISQSYLLIGTVLLLLIGRISDLFGKVKIYNIGFIIFTAGSAICALSSNPVELIVSRTVQGVGYAIIIAESAAIITDSSPEKELGSFLGINVTAWRVGSIAGLTLSGLILSVVDWRGLFYINIPIGIFGTVWAYRELREVGSKDLSKKMDWTGFILFAIGITLLLLAVTYLSYGITGSTLGYFFAGLGALAVALFVKAESRSSSPLLDLRLLKIKVFAGANIAQLVNGLVFSGFMLLVSFYLQIGAGYSPLQSGVAIVPMEAAYLVFSLISGRLSDKYGTRGLSSFGLLIASFGILLVFTFNQSTPYAEVATLLLVIGVGNGLFNSPNTRAIMSSVPINRRGIAAAFRATMYNVGFTASYGLVILFITFGVSYNTFSLLLQGIGTHSLPTRIEFIDGFRTASLIFGILEAIAIIPNFVGSTGRGKVGTEGTAEDTSSSAFFTNEG